MEIFAHFIWDITGMFALTFGAIGLGIVGLIVADAVQDWE